MGGLLYIHVAISLVGIASGFIVVFGMLAAKPLPGWTALFLWTTVATSATGFPLPAAKFLPSHAIGILSLIALAIALYALYGRHLAGAWRKAYIINAVIALYFNMFVFVVQTFRHMPTLKALAPTQTEPPFAIVQGAVLIVFVLLGVGAAKRFQPSRER
ncbi:MAG: hypothetical protein ACREKL_13510 [Chthoniobacterales bacterium]